MKKLAVMALLAALVCAPLQARAQEKAQEKPKSAEVEKRLTPLQVQVIFHEFEGEKKIGSIPYTILLNADDRDRPFTNLRMGVRVPVYVGSKDQQFQYVDVGSNIDCGAQSNGDGRYKLMLTVERSSIHSYSSLPDYYSPDRKPEEQARTFQPLVRQFKVNLHLLLRDGESQQSVVATDPQSGRVLKVDVTLRVVK
jgi:hypothetical protein